MVPKEAFEEELARILPNTPSLRMELRRDDDRDDAAEPGDPVPPEPELRSEEVRRCRVTPPPPPPPPAASLSCGAPGRSGEADRSRLVPRDSLTRVTSARPS